MTNSTQVERARLRACRVLLAISTVLSSGVAAPALAQNAPAPERLTLDANGVDLVNGTYHYTFKDVSIGPDSLDGLAYRRISGQVDSSGGYQGWVNVNTTGSPTIVYITIGRTSEAFSQSGSSYIPVHASGSTLVNSSGQWIYTNSSGVEYTLFLNTSDPNSTLTGITKIKYPTGQIVDLHYVTKSFTITPCNTRPCPTIKRQRLSSITNNLGYQLKFSYQSNALTNSTTWLTLVQVQAINNKVDYCDPTADVCTGLTQDWPKATYSKTGVSGSTVTTVVNDRGQSWNFTNGSNYFGIKRPTAASDTTAVTLSGGKVSSVTNEGVTTNYSFVDASGTRTATATTPDSAHVIVKSSTATGLVSSSEDKLGHITSYEYDGFGRLNTITYPEGNKVVYGLDGRGNITSTTLKAKATAPASDIVAQQASFPVACTNQLTCNQPTWVKDSKGNQTDYTYDPATGAVSTATLPAASAGAVRPQVRYGYSSLQANYKNSAGTVVPSGFPVVKLTSVSQCRTTASCVGLADETRRTIVFDSNSNLLPTAQTISAGDSSLSATTSTAYDAIGNAISVDGPLAGTADTTYYRYGPGRLPAGATAPDPDGGGVRAAQRITYTADGQPTLSELGTVTDITDAAWAAFSPQQQVRTAYDANGRKARTELTATGASVNSAVTEYGYDSVGRLTCVVQRMDPAQWASQTDHCLPQTTGPNGPDRLTKYTYDNADRVTKVTSGYDTADASDDVTTTYTDNGQAATVADGKGNTTTYEYDGFDRLVKTRFPSPTVIGASSATDYEELTLDPNGNVSNRRLRDGRTIGYSYDALNRVTAKTVPSGVFGDLDVSYEYDLLGHLTRATDAVSRVNVFGYDALGRLVSDGKLGGTTSYAYDAAGRRTRMTWSDGFYVDYDYDATGNVTAIRENGATSGAGVLASYGYDDLGRRTSLTRGNGVVTSYGYDAVSRLASLTNDIAGTAQDLTVTFGYNPASQITSRTASNDAYAWGGAINVDRPYTANGLNQYSAAGGVAFGYDAGGNLTSSGSTSYAYTAENRLATASTNGAIMAYEPAGGELLQLYTGDGADRRFVTSGGQIISETRIGIGLVGRYVFGPGADEPLVSYDASGNRSWLIADERGSIIAKTDATGTATATASYDEYGIPSGGDVGRFGYTGQAWLGEIGMSYYKARMYSPTLGRFMQPDPIGYGDGLNLYAYVSNDPLNWTDPSGNAGCVISYQYDENGVLMGVYKSGCGDRGDGSGASVPAWGWSSSQGTGSTGRGGGTSQSSQSNNPIYLTKISCFGDGLALRAGGNALVDIGGAGVAIGGTGVIAGTGLGVYGAATGNIPAAGLGALIEAPSAVLTTGSAIVQGTGALLSFLGGNSLRTLVKNGTAAIVDRIPGLPSAVQFSIKNGAKYGSDYIPDIRTCDRGY